MGDKSLFCLQMLSPDTCIFASVRSSIWREFQDGVGRVCLLRLVAGFPWFVNHEDESRKSLHAWLRSGSGLYTKVRTIMCTPRSGQSGLRLIYLSAEGNLHQQSRLGSNLGEVRGNSVTQLPTRSALIEKGASFSSKLFPIDDSCKPVVVPKSQPEL